MNDIAHAAIATAAASHGWEAALSLSYANRDGRSVLTRREHRGPLVVQKSLYPEGDAVCQSIIVHPPAGIVGGDQLALDVAIGEHVRAQLTTPGAAKWYRSAAAPAKQRLNFSVAADGLLEWLPQETIVFDGAIGELETRIALSRGAIFLGWEIVCLGRYLAGERLDSGSFRQDVAVRRDGVLQWTERAVIAAGSALLTAAVGLRGQPVFGTFLAAAPELPNDLVATCRDVRCEEGEIAVTRLAGVLLARYRGASVEAAKGCFAKLWARVRPALAGRDAVPPRIWNT